jgi:hypothetical protein
VRRRALVVAALAAGSVSTTLAPAPASAATATGRWVVASERAVPLEWFQGLTHGGDGARFFDGIFEGVTRTDAALRQRVRTEAAIPAEVNAQYGFNHVGDPTYDARGGGRLLLPLECYTPGGPNGGNTCGRGGIGVLDPVTLKWRRLFLFDGRDVPKTMWAEVAPGGRLLWTSSGRDLVAYRTADLSPANATPAGPLRPARRIAGAVPPGGVTGGAFRGRRLLLAEPGDGRLRVWSVNTGDTAGAASRRVEATLRVDAEAEGLDVLPTGDGLLHFLLSPVAPNGSPTYGTGHSEIVSFVPRSASALGLRVARLGDGDLGVRVSLRLDGRVLPVAGAVVRAAGAQGRTGAGGRVTLRTGAALPRRVVVTARRAQLRGRAVSAAGAAPTPAFAG